jgi:nitroreductase
MSLEDLLACTRSFRRFRQQPAIDEKTLVDLVSLTRLCASAANRQPLKYVLSCDTERNKMVFAHLHWAASLKDWGGPAEDERPTGYIVILGDKRIAKDFYCDHGIAAQSMLLAATERGFGGCMIASIDREALARGLRLPAHFEILLALALGTPGETVVLEYDRGPEAAPYWRDSASVHHVPKRPLDELILRIPEGPPWTEDAIRPETLVSLATEAEAASIVTALADRDIEATAIEGSAFAGAIGLDGAVEVVVKHADLDRAKQALAEIRKEFSDMDWSKIDVGESEDSTSDPPR